MKITLRTVILFVIGLAFFSPLIAAGPGTAVLPFRVTGAPPPSMPPAERMPELIQEAAAFIFEVNKNYPLISVDSTNRSLRRIGFDPDSTLDQKKAFRLCTETEASFLLSGTAHFSSGGGLNLTLSSFSCKNQRVISRSKSSGHVNRIQSLLKDLVNDSAEYAPDRAGIYGSAMQNNNRTDFGFIIDGSGSTARELSSIQKSIALMLRDTRPEDRSGGVIIGKKRTVLPFSENHDSLIRDLRNIKPSGNTDIKDLVSALSEFEQIRSHGKLIVIIFYDGRIMRETSHTLEERIRRLRRKGIQVNFFPLSGMDHDSLHELYRLQRAAGVNVITPTYGRAVGFLEGFSIFIIRSGLHFFRSDRNVRNEIERGGIDLRSLVPLDLIHYRKEQLNLDSFPEAYASLNRLKVTGMGPIVSDLEFRLHNLVTQNETTSHAPYSILLKNGGHSFWINVKRLKDVKTIEELSDRSFYIGLRFKKSRNGENRLVNDPDSIVIKRQKDVPRLLINNMENLLRIPNHSVRSEDIWFLLVSVKDIKDDKGNRDIRE